MIRSCWSCIRKVIKKEDDWNSSVHKRMVNQDNKYYGGIAPFVVVILLFSLFLFLLPFFSFSHFPMFYYLFVHLFLLLEMEDWNWGKDYEAYE